MSHTVAESPASGWAAGQGSGDGRALLETTTRNQNMTKKESKIKTKNKTKEKKQQHTTANKTLPVVFYPLFIGIYSLKSVCFPQ